MSTNNYEWEYGDGRPFRDAGEVVQMHNDSVRELTKQLAAEKLRADALHEALSELVDGIEDAGGHDENGDVFDIGKAVAALALGGKEQT